jgi:Asp-tRNA(Asn)/Glu-tRNA(Gln) amidotransferase C subunit
MTDKNALIIHLQMQRASIRQLLTNMQDKLSEEETNTLLDKLNNLQKMIDALEKAS